MMHGNGVYKWGDGRIFMGAYLDDRKSGMGCYLWADGRAYHGEWLAGKQHGSGFYIVPDANSSSLKIKIISRRGRQRLRVVMWELLITLI